MSELDDFYNWAADDTHGLAPYRGILGASITKYRAEKQTGRAMSWVEAAGLRASMPESFSTVASPTPEPIPERRARS